MLNKFAELISHTKKNSLEKYCKYNTINSQEFVDFIIACKSGLTHLNHVTQGFDHVPKHLETRKEDFGILRAEPEIRNSSKGQKAIRRLFKSHGQRKCIIGHMFISKELEHPIKEWHFVFFEVDELRDRNNHWKGGSHIHFVNYLWPNLYAKIYGMTLSTIKSFLLPLNYM